MCAVLEQLLGGSWRLDQPYLILVLERCKCSLHDALADHASIRMPWVLRRYILEGTARAMNYLHYREPLARLRRIEGAEVGRLHVGIYPALFTPLPRRAPGAATLADAGPAASLRRCY